MPATIEVPLPDGRFKTLYLNKKKQYCSRKPKLREISAAELNQRRKNGKKVHLHQPSVADTGVLIDNVAKALLETGRGIGFRDNPLLNPLSRRDRERLKKLTRMSAEEFNKKLSDRLADLTDLIVKDMGEKLRGKEFKASELAFALNIVEQRRALLDGRSSLANAQINIQVNNLGAGMSKEELIAQLTDVSPGGVTALAVEQQPVEVSAESGNSTIDP